MPVKAASLSKLTATLMSSCQPSSRASFAKRSPTNSRQRSNPVLTIPLWDQRPELLQHFTAGNNDRRHRGIASASLLLHHRNGLRIVDNIHKSDPSTARRQGIPN